MKTLYLMESEGIEVRRDGPSLWVIRSGQAGQRVPIRWIERVVITGNVRLDADVITLFTMNHVPVVFLNRAGRMVGIALPADRLPEGSSGSLNRRFQQILHNPQWRERYRNWLAHSRTDIQGMVLLHIDRQIGERLLEQGWKEEVYEAVIRRCAPQWSRDDFYSAVLIFFEGLFCDLLLRILQKAKLDPATVTLDPGRRFGLLDDFRRVCRAELMRLALEFTRQVDVRLASQYRDPSNQRWTSYGWKKLVGYFERNQPHLNDRVQRLIHELESLVWEESL